MANDNMDAKKVFESYVQNVNAGNLEAIMDLFDTSVTIPPQLKMLFQGDAPKETLRNYIGKTVIAANGEMEIVRIAVTPDGWAYGDLVLASDMVRQFGQERICGIDQILVREGKIVDFKFMPNILDEQTRAYYTNMGVLGNNPPAN